MKKYGFRVRICVFVGIFYTRGLKLCVGKISRAKYVAPYSRALSNYYNSTNKYIPITTFVPSKNLSSSDRNVDRRAINNIPLEYLDTWHIGPINRGAFAMQNGNLYVDYAGQWIPPYFADIGSVEESELMFCALTILREIMVSLH